MTRRFNFNRYNDFDQRVLNHFKQIYLFLRLVSFACKAEKVERNKKYINRIQLVHLFISL